MPANPSNDSNTELYSAKAHLNSTILIVDAEKTEVFNYPKWQIKYAKPAFILLSGICLALLIGLITITIRYASYAHDKRALEQQIATLKNASSAEIEAKLAHLKKSEASIRALEAYLKEREVDIPQVSFDSKRTGLSTPSSTRVNNNVTTKRSSQANANEAAGGPMLASELKLSKPIPYIGNFSVQVDYLLKTSKTIPFGRPHSGSLSSGFGIRANPFTGRGSEGHGGLDFRGKTGEPIKVTADGVVDFAGTQRGYGNVVIVQHANDFKTYYAHLSAISVAKGQAVKVGDVVGKLGSTGRSTGPHLHYEVRINNERKDPKPYINF